jgi:hypothetical protein
VKAIRLALLPILLASPIARAQTNTKADLTCQLAPGWQPSEPPHHYTADNLYDYKDGGAEGYLIFGFSGMTSITCKSSGNTLTIDLSEMIDADSAYGLFSANTDPRIPIVKIGMGGQVQPQSAIFAKGKYCVELVEIAADPNSDHTAQLAALAAQVEQRLDGRDTPPDALGWFTTENLASTRVVPESVLGLPQLKRGYVATYKQGQAFIVPESSPDAAAEVLKQLRTHFKVASTASPADEAFQTKAPYLDGICIFRKGRYVAGYANLPTAQDATAQAAKLATRIP